MWPARIGALLLGGFACVVATLLHRVGTEVGGVFVPWGLVSGVVTAFFVASAATAWSSLAEFFMGGWALALSIGLGIVGGSQLIVFDWIGVAFLVGGLGAVVAAQTPRIRL